MLASNRPLTLIFDSVRRDDLYSSDSEDEAVQIDAAEAQAKLQAQLAALYGPISTASETVQPDAEDLPDVLLAEEEEFEFCLFAPSSKPLAADASSKAEETVKPIAKIVLSHSDDEDADLGEGKFTRMRKDGWWMTNITEAMRAEFKDVAVTPEMLSAWSRARHYGLEKPWKVRIIHTGLKLSRTQLIQSSNEFDAVLKKKTKPNKKRRIELRKKAAEKAKKLEQDRLAKEKKLEEKRENEEGWAEKRNARNRERKQKRRERERKKKEALKAGREPEPDSESEAETGAAAA